MEVTFNCSCGYGGVCYSIEANEAQLSYPISGKFECPDCGNVAIVTILQKGE